MSSTKTLMNDTAEEFYILADNIIFNTLLYNNEEFFNKPDTSTELSNIEIMLENLNTELGKGYYNMIGTFIQNSMPDVRQDDLIKRMEATVPTPDEITAGGGRRLAPSNSLYRKLLALGERYANFTHLSKYVVIFLVVFHVIFQYIGVANRHQLMYMTDSYAFEKFLNMEPSMNQTQVVEVMEVNRQIYNNNTFFQEDEKAQIELVKWVRQRAGVVDKFKTTLSLKIGQPSQEKIYDIHGVLNVMLNSEYSLPKSNIFKTCYLKTIQAHDNESNNAPANKGQTQGYDESLVQKCADSAFLQESGTQRYHSIVSCLVEIFWPEPMKAELNDFLLETEEGIKEFDSKHGIQTTQIISIKLASNILYLVNDVLDTFIPGVETQEQGQEQVQEPISWGIRSTLSHFTYKILVSMMSFGDNERTLMNAMKIHFENKANLEIINYDVKTTKGHLFKQATETFLNKKGLEALYQLAVNFKTEDAKSVVKSTLSNVADDQLVPINNYWKYKIYSQIFDVFADILENKDVSDKIKVIIELGQKHLLVTAARELASNH